MNTNYIKELFQKTYFYVNFDDDFFCFGELNQMIEGRADNRISRDGLLQTWIEKMRGNQFGSPLVGCVVGHWVQDLHFITEISHSIFMHHSMNDD